MLLCLLAVDKSLPIMSVGVKDGYHVFVWDGVQVVCVCVCMCVCMCVCVYVYVFCVCVCAHMYLFDMYRYSHSDIWNITVQDFLSISQITDVRIWLSKFCLQLPKLSL